MRVAVNVEFTDEELRKYVADVSRRVIATTLEDTVKAVNRMKLGPKNTQALAGVLGALAGVIGQRAQPKTPPGFVDPCPECAEDPGPTAHGPSPSVRTMPPCSRIEPKLGVDMLDEGWLCCGCGIYNGIQRSTCRQCKHERCDVVVPPAPSADADPSVGRA